MVWWMYLIAGLFLYAIIIVFLSKKYPETHYDSENIDCQDYQFPDNFTWGVATASHQIEGNNNNNWTDFEKRTGIEQSEGACEHWTNWKQDFQLIQNLGVKSYRFSIEWSRIQPEKDSWNEDALNQYCEMIDDLISKGIKPMVTLHHFSHPIWFEEIGGFLSQENISHWTKYCKKVFSKLYAIQFTTYLFQVFQS